MLLSDIVARVQSLLDDPEGTFITSDYVIGFSQHEYEKLYNKLKLVGSSFDSLRIEIEALEADTPDLDELMGLGKPLEALVTPRIVEWKLVDQPDTLYRVARGPLEQVRDVIPGTSGLDSWAYNRRSLKLSSFSAPLDLRITGEFLFTPLSGPESPIEISPLCNVTLACQIAAAIGKAKGNPGWISQYTDDAKDAFDDLALALVRQEQGKVRRLARISYHYPSQSFVTAPNY